MVSMIYRRCLRWRNIWAKGSVRLLTKTVALENAPLGIRCNSIHPGIIDTPIMDPLFDAAPDRAAMRAQIEQSLPIGYMGDPARDIGNMAVYLGSDESIYITNRDTFYKIGFACTLVYFIAAYWAMQRGKSLNIK